MASTARVAAGLDSAFPPADVVIHQLTELAVPNPLRRALLQHATRLLGINRHCENTRRRMIALAEQGINPFDQETIDPIFNGLYPELSFSGLLEDATPDPFQRAAHLVYATLQTRNQSPATTRDAHLYGRTVALYKRGLALRKRFQDHPDSETIIVVTHGHYYYLRVLDNGTPLSPATLTATLQAIAHDAAQQPALSGHGALTAVVNRATIQAVHQNPTHPALFLLALDLHAHPTDTEALGRQVHIAGFENRDYRQALQLVVCGNGKAGAVFNLFAGIEGVTAARFLSTIATQNIPTPLIPTTPTPAPFTRIPLTPHPKLTQKAEARLQRAIATAPYSHRINTIGKDRIKALGVSPDAFLHAAIHLAYQNTFHRTPEAYNFIDLSTQQFGSISRYPCTTDALRQFLQNPTKPNLQAALNAHKQAITQIRTGNHPLHYVYHYLFATPGLKALFTVLLFTLLIPRFQARFLLPDLWMSNIPAQPGLISMCRHAITLSFLRNQAYTCHYLLFPDHIRINLSAKNNQNHWPIQESLTAALQTLETLLKP